MKCKHCEEEFNDEEDCPKCEKPPENQCLTCHLEVEHGILTNQNIHICGGASPPQNDPRHIGGDLDAYRPSWRSQP